MNALIIVMDRKPTGRRPVTIKRISCGEKLLYEAGGKNALPENLIARLGTIRTQKQLDALREDIKNMEENGGVEDGK